MGEDDLDPETMCELENFGVSMPHFPTNILKFKLNCDIFCIVCDAGCWSGYWSTNNHFWEINGKLIQNSKFPGGQLSEFQHFGFIRFFFRQIEWLSLKK